MILNGKEVVINFITIDVRRPVVPEIQIKTNTRGWANYNHSLDVTH